MGFLSFIRLTLSAAVVLLISSCATLSGSGVGRVKHYSLESDRLPASFDGMRVAFLSDLHLPSKFTPVRLRKLVARLHKEAPDVLFFGGDYASSGDNVQQLFSSFSSLKTTFGKFAVLGNHDYRLRDTVAVAMRSAGVHLLADEVAYLCKASDSVAVVGIYNPFNPSPVAKQLTRGVCERFFTVLLSHTPDFAQDADARCDLMLSGHTHGGQVSLLGLYTPVKNTKYGSRFLRGRNYTDNGTPVITTNGVGTSRRKVRFWVPSEVIIVTLRSNASVE